MQFKNMDFLGVDPKSFYEIDYRSERHWFFVRQEMKQYFVYILASRKKGTLYVGVTSNLERRIEIHKSNYVRKSFTAKYNVHNLVYYESFDNPNDAIYREKQLKWWKREWKIGLIEKLNPDRKDLSIEI